MIKSVPEILFIKLLLVSVFKVCTPSNNATLIAIENNVIKNVSFRLSKLLSANDKIAIISNP